MWQSDQRRKNRDRELGTSVRPHHASNMRIQVTRLQLQITDKQLDNRIRTTKKFMNNIFSYFEDTNHRHRIYKTHISPNIDFFLIQYIFNNTK